MRVKEIADKLGVSAATVRRAVAELDLERSGHASRADARGLYDIDADGASMVARHISGAATAATPARSAPAAVDDSASVAYQAAIDGLRAALESSESTRRALELQLSVKDEQIERLSRQLDQANERAASIATMSWWQRLFGRALPAARTD